MKRSVRKSFKWLLVLGMIAGLLGALLPTGPAAAGSLSFSTTTLPTAKSMVVNDMIKGPGSANGRNVLAVSPDYANDSRIWAALDNDGDSVQQLITADPDNAPDGELIFWRVGPKEYRLGDSLPVANADGDFAEAEVEIDPKATIKRRAAFDDGVGVDEVAYSTNGGITWAAADPSGTDNSPIVAIVPSPLYASDNTVFVASTTTVYRSTNGGSSYTQLGQAQGNGALVITSLSAAPNYNGTGEVAIGLAATAEGVAACPDGPSGAGSNDCARVWGRGDRLFWDSIATNDMAADVTAIAYSPSFSADGVVMVVGSADIAGTDDGTNDLTHIKAGTALYHVVGPGAAWGEGFDSVVIDDELTNVDISETAATDTGIVSSALAVPPDYDGSDSAKRVVYVGVNSLRAAVVQEDGDDVPGPDGIYRVTKSKGTLREAGTDVSNIAFAGTIGSPRVLFSDASNTNGNAALWATDFTSGSSAPNFTTGRPVPGADGNAGSSGAVGISPDGGTAFALVNSAFTLDDSDPPVPVPNSYAPSGNGGFSRSADGGKTYSQVSLLNNVGAFTVGEVAAMDAVVGVTADPQADPPVAGVTAVDAVTAVTGAAIAGFAVAPDFDTSGQMIAAAASARGSDVIIHSANGGANWMVVDTRDLGGDIAFAYSPDFATDNTIYSAVVGSKILERSTNGGLSWASRSNVVCGGSTVSSIAAADGSTVFVGCASGSFRKSVNGGFLFTTARGTGSGDIDDIVMSPSYSEDNSILIGHDGDVRLSTNGGSSFSELGTAGSREGMTQVAFHNDYATNSMVYVGTPQGVYRWTVGTSTSWTKSFGATMVVGLGVGADGTLYVASMAPFAEATDDDDAAGGIFASADPTASSVTLAQVGVAKGGDPLERGEMVGGFAHANVDGSERLWVSITNPGGKTATSGADNWRHYTDTIGSMLRPGGLTPADGAVVGVSNAAGSGVTGFRIGWDAVAGATDYTYEWSTSSDFDSGCDSATAGARSVSEGSICDDAGVRAGNTTYYWRVQVAAPVVGPWSATQSLTTTLIAGVAAGLPTLSQPNAGNLAPETSREVPLRPLFVWTGVNGATHYDLQVSTDGTFLDPNQMVVDRSGATRLGNQIAFQSDAQLSPSTVYFWRVRGVSATSMGAYPPAAAFTTTSSAAATGRPAGQTLAALEATGNLEVVTGYDYASGLWQSYVPGLPGNSLATIQPNSVLFITVMEDTTVIVSGVAYNISADTPTPIPVGAAVTIVVQ